MVTEVVKEESGIRGMYIMGENPIISDPDIARLPARPWCRRFYHPGRRTCPRSRTGTGSGARCPPLDSPGPRLAGGCQAIEGSVLMGRGHH
jgi:hypothetical protein